MAKTFKQNRTCPICGSRVSDQNLSGYCNRHRDRTGPNNPFWGKTHTDSTKAKLKEKCKEASRKMWEDESYRSLVIERITGLKRSDEFKETQRQRAKQQFKDTEQRTMRAKKMAETWKRGAIVWSPHHGNPVSKEQIKFGEHLKAALGDRSDRLVTNKTIKSDDRYLMPDFIYENIIIEYNGDFWHANPAKYNAADIVHHGRTAKEIWEHDAERIALLESLGYQVIQVWGSDYQTNDTKIISEIVQKLTICEQKETI